MLVRKTETCLYCNNNNTNPHQNISILFDKGPQAVKFSSGIRWDILKYDLHHR